MTDFEIEDVPFELKELEPKPILKRPYVNKIEKPIRLNVPVFTEEEKLSFKHGTYVGTLDHLQGYPVKIRKHHVSDNLLLVQFDLVDDREWTIFCNGWTTFLATDFEINDG